MPIGKVWIYRLLFVCFFCLFFCVCTVTDFSAEDKASDVNFFLGGSSATEAWNHTFLSTLFLQKPKIGRIGQRAGRAHRAVNITVEMRRRKRHARDAPFVEYRAACGRRIGMCGYRSVLTDVLV